MITSPSFSDVLSFLNHINKQKTKCVAEQRGGGVCAEVGYILSVGDFGGQRREERGKIAGY